MDGVAGREIPTARWVRRAIVVLLLFGPACSHDWSGADAGADAPVDDADGGGVAEADAEDGIEAEAEVDAGADVAEETEGEGEAEVPAACGNGFLDAGEECDDGNEVNDDGCDACFFSCHENAECGDGNACTSDLCTSVDTGRRCSNAILAGDACDDGDACTSGEFCGEDGACGGGALVCDCHRDTDCESREDGNLCNGTLYCDMLTLICRVNPATIVTCDSSSDTDCRRNTCAPTSGLCSMLAVADGMFCDDLRSCTVGDRCVAGTCVGEAPAESCNGLDDDCDTETDEGVSCTNVDNLPVCPGGRDWTTCATAGECRRCTCAASLVWTTCGTCGVCP